MRVLVGGMMWTLNDVRDVGREVRRNPRLVGSLLVHAVMNTIEAGWDAPQRWYGFFRGKPYWRYLPRNR